MSVFHCTPGVSSSGEMLAGEMQTGKGLVSCFSPAVRTESKAALHGRQEAKLNWVPVSTKC